MARDGNDYGFRGLKDAQLDALEKIGQQLAERRAAHGPCECGNSDCDSPRYGYTTKYRPISIGFTVPREGWICERTDPATRTHANPYGVIHYSRELTAEELAQWEMRRVD